MVVVAYRPFLAARWCAAALRFTPPSYSPVFLSLLLKVKEAIAQRRALLATVSHLNGISTEGGENETPSVEAETDDGNKVDTSV